jgi:phospholipase/carboxylesterase
MQTVTCRLGPLEALRVGDPATARAVIVLLHGYAMRPEDLEPFARSLKLPALFYFPRGPRRVEPERHCWWPIDEERRARALAVGPRDLHEEFPPGKTAARGALNAALDAACAEAPGLPLVLGGFSQGGMLSCDTVLHGRKVAGLVLLSASRLSLADWEPRAHALARLPVLVSHGRQDPDLSFGAGEALRDFCRKSGAQVTWQSFDGGHEIPLVVWRALRRFLAGL